jgi:maltose alpha-D-glucosyltransferase/alpha-amylase
VPGLDLAGPGLKNDPNWYRKAVFYEVLVRAFADSNGSGRATSTA